METKEIFDLFERFEKSSLNEISIKQGDMEVVLKKGGELPSMQHMQPPVNMPIQHHYAEGVRLQEQHLQPVEKQPDTEIITSPIVGTFYRAPAPDAPPFVDVGAKVKTGDTICILEAMKLMNELEAELDCEIVKILVENGKMVEFNTPLFEVRRI
ncbi:MAG: acetyl-CoA carboxylase biotin carboxyl carrier protein [Spirochaetales bacterium]|nr:acetyl-CoA carboxylase biotin carboxyl carrier protein [Spirochaetales bacterium]